MGAEPRPKDVGGVVFRGGGARDEYMSTTRFSPMLLRIHDSIHIARSRKSAGMGLTSR